MNFYRIINEARDNPYSPFKKTENEDVPMKFHLNLKKQNGGDYITPGQSIQSKALTLNPTSESDRCFRGVLKSVFLAKRSYEPAVGSLNGPHAVSGSNTSENPQKGRNSQAVFLPAIPFLLKSDP